MNVVLLIVLALSLGPVVLAIAIHFFSRRLSPLLGRRVGVLTVIAGLVPAIGAIVSLFASWIPLFPLNPDLAWRAVTPLVLGILAIPLLMVPPPRAHTIGVAPLSRRSVAQFMPRSWSWALLVLVVITFGITIAAGMASTRDDEGHFTMFWTRMGSSSFGTQIYGWYCSASSMIALAALLLLTFCALLVVASRAWTDDIETDAALRHRRALNIVRTASGVVLLHLAVILGSLASTASLRGESLTSELGTVAMGTSFAALGPLLSWLGMAAFVAGLTACLLTSLAAISVRRRVSVLRP